MKTPHLLASLAVAATATAAELKDSSEVARAWEKSTAPAESLRDDLSLRGITAPPPREFPAVPPVFRNKPENRTEVPSWGKPQRPSRPEPGLDAPRNPPPSVLPNNDPMPRGAKPWLYGGQTYWLMPLIPSDPARTK